MDRGRDNADGEANATVSTLSLSAARLFRVPVRSLCPARDELVRFSPQAGWGMEGFPRRSIASRIHDTRRPAETHPNPTPARTHARSLRVYPLSDRDFQRASSCRCCRCCWLLPASSNPRRTTRLLSRRVFEG